MLKAHDATAIHIAAMSCWKPTEQQNTTVVAASSRDVATDKPQVEDDRVSLDILDRVNAAIAAAVAADAQGWKLMCCSHCQGLCQQASWLLIGCTRVNNQSEARSEG